jgi:hypothetical protein
MPFTVYQFNTARCYHCCPLLPLHSSPQRPSLQAGRPACQPASPREQAASKIKPNSNFETNNELRHLLLKLQSFKWCNFLPRLNSSSDAHHLIFGESPPPKVSQACRNKFNIFFIQPPPPPPLHCCCYYCRRCRCRRRRYIKARLAKFL